MQLFLYFGEKHNILDRNSADRSGTSLGRSLSKSSIRKTFLQCGTSHWAAFNLRRESTENNGTPVTSPDLLGQARKAFTREATKSYRNPQLGIWLEDRYKSYKSGLDGRVQHGQETIRSPVCHEPWRKPSRRGRRCCAERKPKLNLQTEHIILIVKHGNILLWRCFSSAQTGQEDGSSLILEKNLLEDLNDPKLTTLV